MTTLVHMADLRPGVADALRILSRSTAGQRVITIGTDAAEVDWSPKAYHHHSLLLPLVLLTAALDHDAALARWQSLRFAEVAGLGHSLDLDQKSILLTLAGKAGSAHFPLELASWIDRFALDGVALRVNRDRLASGDHYGVRPIAGIGEMAAVLKGLEVPRRLATLAVLALYNDSDTNKAFGGRRGAALNPPAVEGFTALREAAGRDAYAHLLRLIAAYRGW